MEVCGSSYQQECIQSLGREDEDEDDVDHGRDEYEEIFGRDDFHKNTINYENVDNVHDNVVDDHDDDAIEFHDDGVQPVVPTYEAHGLSFHANTWDNIVDPSNVEILFSSSWVKMCNKQLWRVVAGKNSNHYIRIIIRFLPRASQLGVMHHYANRHQLQWMFADLVINKNVFNL